ncbi:hypothetical protein FOCG_10949 [Fusarium oxysporum f. sp. radicis-lycopersici 26381]|uniref:Uncharacterized protein n=1 Tax=Fusarium oxysporum Fo47 TaxID=660027 RepID=W9JWN7_FUSOX|nr:hypothetical protein FOZG_12722 [Fusarium oxysporum Fo47]EXL48631.1 hypothetical protein FOCG_10949 [Fusarium oxysporum f. sp. radicis-lycopersici 26381]
MSGLMPPPPFRIAGNPGNKHSTTRRQASRQGIPYHIQQPHIGCRTHNDCREPMVPTYGHTCEIVWFSLEAQTSNDNCTTMTTYLKLYCAVWVPEIVTPTKLAADPQPGTDV